MTKETTTLYYRRGPSDKIYHAEVVEIDDGFGVSFAYGRRGSTLQTGMKTNTPVSFDEAKKIYDKIVREKTAKGYTPGANGTPYDGTENAQRNTGILPQLLNPIDDALAEVLIADPNYWMQQKMDGRRVLIQATDTVTGINRKGLTIALPKNVVESAAEIGVPFIIDGEAVGNWFYAFDLLSLNGRDCRSNPFRERHDKLFNLIGQGSGAIELLETFNRTAEKTDAFERLKSKNAEGVVFKLTDAPYTPGRPASAGPQLKFKFVATGSFIVAGVNIGKRSVGLEALNDKGKSVYVGNVTVPANQKIPAVGTIAEVRFLYAFREGCLYQPVMLGVRDDIDVKDCTTAQLKYKPEETDDGE